MALSQKRAQALGWTRRAGDGRYGSANYQHRDGWNVNHCGHPTALWPWLLIDPDGDIVLMGARGPWRNPTYGTAWTSVEDAINYVAEIGLTRRQLLKVCRWQ